MRAYHLCGGSGYRSVFMWLKRCGDSIYNTSFWRRLMGANKFTHTCLVDTLSLSALKVPSLIYKGEIDWAYCLLPGLTCAHSIRRKSMFVILRRIENGTTHNDFKVRTFSISPYEDLCIIAGRVLDPPVLLINYPIIFRRLSRKNCKSSCAEVAISPEAMRLIPSMQAFHLIAVLGHECDLTDAS